MAISEGQADVGRRAASCLREGWPLGRAGAGPVCGVVSCISTPPRAVPLCDTRAGSLGQPSGTRHSHAGSVIPHSSWTIAQTPEVCGFVTPQAVLRRQPGGRPLTESDASCLESVSGPTGEGPPSCKTVPHLRCKSQIVTCTSLLVLFIYLFLREAERESTHAHKYGEGQRERETQNPEQAPGSELSAQNPMWLTNCKIMT